MSFPHKPFRGQIYRFEHLAAFTMPLALDAQSKIVLPMHVSFSAHCFTEVFDTLRHQPEHRYTYASELRAFDEQRHALSLQLPALVQAIAARKVNFTRENNYLLVEQQNLAGQLDNYAVFFDLVKDKTGKGLRMYVQSAYVKAALPKSLDAIRFRILAAALWEGRRVHSPQIKQHAKLK